MNAAPSLGRLRRMAHWLLKTEPSTYSYADLARERQTRWDGVANPVAAKHLRAMQPGDELVVYHTGGEKAAVGLATVVAAGDPPTIAPVRPLAKPVALATLKADPLFADSPLVRQGRLSVVPLTAAQYARLVKLAA